MRTPRINALGPGAPDRRSLSRTLGTLIALLIAAVAVQGCGQAAIQPRATDLVTAPDPSLSATSHPTIEEQRVDDALLVLNDQRAAIANALQFAPLGKRAAAAATGEQRSALVQQAVTAGNALWTSGVHNAQQPATQTLDDRPLYWRRLLEKREFRVACENPDQQPSLCADLLAVFERASRGASPVQFAAADNPRTLRILVSGFDPFGLDENIDQSNPSGAAALALDGVIFTANGVSAEIQSVLFPVRFADFDEGMVEDVFEPLITNNAIDLLITISMGRSDFDLERFPGRRRSAEAPDNVRVRTGASADNPLVPMLSGALLAGPEFVEFSLPIDALRQVQTPYPVNDNRRVTTLEQGAHDAPSLASLSQQSAVRGSGGGYLSNEISYRSVHLVRSHNADIAVGHIHTPRLSGYDVAQVTAIAGQIRQMLEAAVAASATATTPATKPATTTTTEAP